jgi:Ras-related protein Rab-1A
MIVGTKMDLEDKREVQQTEGLGFARENGLAFIETSAKDSIGVDTAFTRIVQEIFKLQVKSQGLNSDIGARSRQIKGETINLSAVDEDMDEEEIEEQMRQRSRGCC